MLNTIQKERLKKEVNATWELATGTKDPVDSNVEMLIDYLTEDDFKCYGDAITVELDQRNSRTGNYALGISSEEYNQYVYKDFKVEKGKY